jgi:2-polyprenyl-6-methoxyphenol hydroxylase-like FAD-dependent oxidoreductase
VMATVPEVVEDDSSGFLLRFVDDFEGDCPVREHAVVCGASIAGLLTARVLSDFYTTVTVVERDPLPDTAMHRKGVPQGRQLHALSIGGSQLIRQLFPDFLTEIAAAGAHVLNQGDLSRVSISVRGHELNRSTTFDDPTAMAICLASRPFLEHHIGSRVRAIGNVRILDAHDVVEPVTRGDRVTGVRVVGRVEGEEQVLDADLVVDAMGRAARTPAFLQRSGYGRPTENRSPMRDVTYASQTLRIPEGAPSEKMAMFFAKPGQTSGGGLLAYEHDTWVLSVGRFAGYEAPQDTAGLIACAAEFAPPRLISILGGAQPVDDLYVIRFPGAVWRRYDRMRRFPAGFLVIGDAICSLNPIYGQGMSVAARQALVLRDCLAGTDTGLSRRFFKGAAKQIRPVWWSNQINDFSLTGLDGRHSALRKVINRRMDATLRAASHDTLVAEKFLRVGHLVDSPSKLFHPSVLMRVASANNRKMRGDDQSIC